MPKRVLPPEAASLVQQGWRYIDVRSIPEFEQAHPEGAFNVPLLHARDGRMAPNQDFQRVIEANFGKGEQLVVGCKAGGRSAQAAALMESLGYTSVVDMRGGFSGEFDAMGRGLVPGWSDAGLPVARAVEPGRSYADLDKKK